MTDYLQSVPLAVQDDVARLAAMIIEHAHEVGLGRWGVTPYDDGIRVNVGWTEILTALPDQLRVIVDGDGARSVDLPDGVSLVEGADERGFYPSVPGSVLLNIPYEPAARFAESIVSIRQALLESVRLAARRRAGRGVQEGHRQQAVSSIAARLGRALPSPGFLGGVHEQSSKALILMEGALRRVVSSEYERSSAARDACIAHHGSSCMICGFSFEAVYGALGAGFIHVHHIVPLASVGGAYVVNPITDLAPVCPNCHAMLHRGDSPMSVEDLRGLVSRPSKA